MNRYDNAVHKVSYFALTGSYDLAQVYCNFLHSLKSDLDNVMCGLRVLELPTRELKLNNLFIGAE